MNRELRALYYSVLIGRYNFISKDMISSDIIYNETGAYAVNISDECSINKQVFKRALSDNVEFSKIIDLAYSDLKI